MHQRQLIYRQLYEALLDHESESVFEDLLAPWCRTHAAELELLLELRDRRGTPIPAISQEENWILYALSRCFDALTLGFQPPSAPERDWAGPRVTRAEYEGFAALLGLDIVESPDFCPFHHEVVRVDAAPLGDAPARIVERLWPCLMLGDLLFLRSGVRVFAGCNVLCPGVADASTLYWTFRRRSRAVSDGSHGWGSNSQWRTAFRRDYRIGERLHYNVDGTKDLHDRPSVKLNRDGLTVAERCELVTHRCFVTTTKPYDDLWPYDDKVVLPWAAP